MKKIVVGSLNVCAGKTSFIVGLAQCLEMPIGYLKPLGDRLLYRKKRQWDHDVLLLQNLGDRVATAANGTLGFDASKLRYMYSIDQAHVRLNQVLDEMDNTIAIIETGSDAQSGTGLGLDPLTLSRALQAQLILIVSGHSQEMVDRLFFWHRFVDDTSCGFVLNKLDDVSEFEDEYGGELKDAGLNILGMIPKSPQLTHYPVSYLCDQLFASVLAGEPALSRAVNNVLLLTSDHELSRADAEFKEKGTVVVTAGDRADVVKAAMNRNAAAIVLTGENEIGPNLVAQANKMGIALLSVRHSTTHTMKTIDRIDPLFDMGQKVHSNRMAELIRTHLDLSWIL